MGYIQKSNGKMNGSTKGGATRGGGSGTRAGRATDTGGGGGGRSSVRKVSGSAARKSGSTKSRTSKSKSISGETKKKYDTLAQRYVNAFEKSGGGKGKMSKKAMDDLARTNKSIFDAVDKLGGGAQGLKLFNSSVDRLMSRR